MDDVYTAHSVVDFEPLVYILWCLLLKVCPTIWWGEGGGGGRDYRHIRSVLINWSVFHCYKHTLKGCHYK
jgi:hypothetical protein